MFPWFLESLVDPDVFELRWATAELQTWRLAFARSQCILCSPRDLKAQHTLCATYAHQCMPDLKSPPFVPFSQTSILAMRKKQPGDEPKDEQS